MEILSRLTGILLLLQSFVYRASLSSVVPTGRTRSNARRLKHVRFHLNRRKVFFL